MIRWLLNCYDKCVRYACSYKHMLVVERSSQLNCWKIFIFFYVLFYTFHSFSDKILMSSCVPFVNVSVLVLCQRICLWWTFLCGCLLSFACWMRVSLSVQWNFHAFKEIFYHSIFSILFLINFNGFSLPESNIIFSYQSTANIKHKSKYFPTISSYSSSNSFRSVFFID